MKNLDSTGFNRTFVLGLLALTVLAGALRLPGVARESLWHDELYTAHIVESDLGTLLEQTDEHDVHPPLYYLLSWSLVRLTGETEVTLRVTSALTGTFTVPLFGAGTALLAGPAAGIAAAALLAVNRSHRFFSGEARSNALLVLLAILSSLSFLLALEAGGKMVFWIHLLSSAALLYTHYFGFVLLSMQFFALAVLWPQAHRRRLWSTLGGLAGAGVLYLPWLGAQLRDMMRPDYWPRQPGPNALEELFQRWWTIDPFLQLLMGALLLAGLVSLVKRRRTALLIGVLIWMFGPICLAYYKSRLSFSVWIPRNFVVCTPGWILLAAIGLSSVRRAWSRHVLLVSLLVTTLIATSSYEQPYLGNRGRVDVRGASEWIMHLNRSVSFPVYGYGSNYVGWYLQRDRHKAWSGRLPRFEAEMPPAFWLLEGHGRLSATQASELGQTHQLILQKDFLGARAGLYADHQNRSRFDRWTLYDLELGPEFRRESKPPAMHSLIKTLSEQEALLLVSSGDFWRRLPQAHRRLLRRMTKRLNHKDLVNGSSVALVMTKSWKEAKIHAKEPVLVESYLPTSCCDRPVRLVAGTTEDPRISEITIDGEPFPVLSNGLTILRYDLVNQLVSLYWTMNSTIDGSPSAAFRLLNVKAITASER